MLVNLWFSSLTLPNCKVLLGNHSFFILVEGRRVVFIAPRVGVTRHDDRDAIEDLRNVGASRRRRRRVAGML